ncbi:hypothetical protein BHE74_00056068, partial [Ensete ventricosum]
YARVGDCRDRKQHLCGYYLFPQAPPVPAVAMLAGGYPLRAAPIATWPCVFIGLGFLRSSFSRIWRKISVRVELSGIGGDLGVRISGLSRLLLGGPKGCPLDCSTEALSLGIGRLGWKWILPRHKLVRPECLGSRLREHRWVG